MCRGSSSGNVDACLHALGGCSRYQMLQLIVISVGLWGAAVQLLDNIFIGRPVTSHHCASPNASTISIPKELRHIQWYSKDVTYGHCEITVTRGDLVETYPCLFGHTYSYPRELSFRTEFDLVCGQALLADMLQTLVIMGQGCGAVVASVLSDRYGRKPVLVWSQVGLLLVGLAVGLAPTYTLLATLKFLAGCLQQGVVTGKATMAIELFPTEFRSLASLLHALLWMMGSCAMAGVAYCLQDYSWRLLQCLLSSVSLLFLLQMWYLDESLRWLVANKRRQAAIGVLHRAARQNGKDVTSVITALYSHEADTSDVGYTPGAGTYSEVPPGSPDAMGEEVRKRTRVFEEDWELVDPGEALEPLLDSSMQVAVETHHTAGEKVGHGSRLSVWDIFRHPRIRFNTFIIWITWFTCAFSTFTLYVMTAGLHGNRFLNYFLTALMELPAVLLFYSIVDRAGRKPLIRLFFILAGVGLTSSGLFRIFEDDSFYAAMSVVMAMLGMLGATGLFGSLFFYTPELYPTNIRQQALGLASLAGRVGGMIAPFMMPLSEIVVWAPGMIAGGLCVVVVVLFQFLPETQGRELPQSFEDIDAWLSGPGAESALPPQCVRGSISRRAKRWLRNLCTTLLYCGRRAYGHHVAGRSKAGVSYGSAGHADTV